MRKKIFKIYPAKLCLHFTGAVLFSSVLFLALQFNDACAWELYTGWEGQSGEESIGGLHTSVVTDHVHSGTQSMKYSMTAGQEGMGVSFSLGSSISEGQEVWVRTYIYAPAGFSWEAPNGPIVKLLRLAIADSGDCGYSYASILETVGQGNSYGCVGGTADWGYMVTGMEDHAGEVVCQNRNMGDGGAYLGTGQWHSIELYIKASATNGILRAWEDGILRNEYFVTTIPSGGHLEATHTTGCGTWISPHMLGWWNGGAPQDQDLYFDDFVWTNEQPVNQDASGNHMIGPTDWTSTPDTTPPASPGGLAVI